MSDIVATITSFFTSKQNITPEQRNRALVLLLVSGIAVLAVGCVAYCLAREQYVKETGKDMSVMDFLNGGRSPSLKSVLIGMGSGVVFGFIDNAGLWFGMDALDPYLPGGPLTKAGLGNTFSDLLGSSLGTFVGLIIQMTLNKDDTPVPVWSEALGVMVGCLFGILVPRMITGKN